MDVRFRPIARYPLPVTAQRTSLQGSQNYSVLLERLETELDHLKASDVVIETGHNPDDIRLDGWVRSNARVPSHPGVRLFLVSKVIRGGKPLGALTLACDKYKLWQDNLRAVVLTLEALRGIDRWKVSESGEQYRGYAALPPAPPADDREKAARLLLEIGGYEVSVANIALMRGGHEESAKMVARRAAANAHPDKGGKSETFRAVQQAREVLGLT